LPPPTMTLILARIMQEIVAGERDVNKLLKALDAEWDSARKGT